MTQFRVIGANMAGTYSQIYIQIVFAVQGRQNLLQKEWRDEVFKYISGIIKNKGHKPIIVNGVSDHVHAFLGLKPAMALSDLVRDMKNNSSNFINDHKWVKGKFCWQEGYGAFSYSHSQISYVYNYILSQEAHHARQAFRAEYTDFLKKFEIQHDAKYLFEWME
jgi:REP element-mobilizing transposase RayT